jgi:hypothetical protein
MRNNIRYVLVPTSFIATWFVFIAFLHGRYFGTGQPPQVEPLTTLYYMGSVGSPADWALILITVWFLAGVGLHAYLGSSWLKITTSYAGAVAFVLGLFIAASLAERHGAELGLGALLNDEVLPSWLFSRLEVFRLGHASLTASTAEGVTTVWGVTGFAMFLGTAILWATPYFLSNVTVGIRAAREMIADR